MSLPIAPRALRLLTVGLVVGLGACDLVTYRPPVGRDFGAPYEVRTGVPVHVAQGSTIETPAIDGSRRLIAVVAYRGGCARHTFSVASESAAGGGSVVWLVHDAGGEVCNDLVRDTLGVDVPFALLDVPLALETPRGTKHVLTAPAGAR